MTAAPAHQSFRPANPAGYLEPLDALCVASWQGIDPPHREWLVPNLIPMGQVTLVTGDGGLGKTLLALQLQAAAALRMPWLGLETLPVRSLGIYCEDDEAELHRRFSDIAQAYRADLGDMENVEIVSRVGEDSALVTFEGRDMAGGGDVTPFYSSILKHAQRAGAQLIVLDSLYDFFPGNENSRTAVHRFGKVLRALARAINGAVVICGHPSVAGINSGSGLSGSTAWNAVVRSRLYLTRPAAGDGEPEDPDARVLTTKKANYGPGTGAIRVRWEDGVFVPEQSGGDFVDRLDATVRARDVFMAGLRDILSQGIQPSWRVEARSLYAPKLIVAKPIARGISLRSLERAMVELMDSRDVVVIDGDGPPSRRRQFIAPRDHPKAGP